MTIKIVIISLLLIISEIASPQAATSPDESLSTVFEAKIYGNGKPIILLPGLMSDSSVYEETIAALQKDFEVHALSLNGFGKLGSRSNDKQLPFSLNLLEESLIRYIRTNMSLKPHIVGHSMGGFTALSMAISYPNEIEKVVSVDGLPFIGPVFTRSNETTADQLRSQADSMLAAFSSMTSSQLADQARRGVFIQATKKEDQEYIIDMAKGSNPQFTGQVMHELMSTDLRLALRSTTTPILLMGASGAFQTTQQHEFIANLYRAQFEGVENAEVKMNTKARHFIMLDSFDWFMANLNAFLSTSAKG
ncbi:alpha/beta hydrolase [Glaciecola sp. MH2013]|uniref:alpha/beta fold hydrolase n=1 Tax=Glaciecola sp. MH2013 TaxID=2785524 RepID=UPI00189C879D|nr:alpha/beta hydrolase [Glaciecola sp. MH2013]MBF7072590.1 alpha/beta hydrolase [Glaciecola sp. MH2013]